MIKEARLRKSNEQRLVDACISLVLIVTRPQNQVTFSKMEEKSKRHFVQDQLLQAGFFVDQECLIIRIDKREF